MLSKGGAVVGTQAGSCQYPGVRWVHHLTARKKYLNKKEEKERDRIDPEESGPFGSRIVSALF